MATLSNRNGRRMIQFPDATGKRRTIHLGQIDRKAAEAIRSHIDQLISHRITRTALPRDTSIWLTEIGASLHLKLVKAGLVEARAHAELGAFIDGFLANRTDLKPSSIRALTGTGKKLVAFFGPRRNLAGITRADAMDFKRHLATTLAKASVTSIMVRSKVIIADALQRKIIVENPFAGIKLDATTNDDRLHYITVEDAKSMIDHAPSAHWRLLFALARFAGVRVASETMGLRWSDVDFVEKKIVIRSPKTERHVGKDRRTIPLFTELEPYLRDVRDISPDDAQFVLDLPANRSVVHQVGRKTIELAGLPQWPRLFQNLRSSCETDLAIKHGIHVACKWIGNSPDIAKRHYLQVLESHYAEASGRAVKSAAVDGGNEGKDTGMIEPEAQITQQNTSTNKEDTGISSRQETLTNLRNSETALRNALRDRVQYIATLRQRDIANLRAEVSKAKACAEPGNGAA